MTEKEKFWYETIRAMLFGIAGFIGVYILAVTFAHNKEYQIYIDLEKIKIREKVIDEYMKESYKYTSLLYDVLNSGGRDVIPDIGTQYDKYRIAMNSMKIYFGPRIDHEINDINKKFIPKLNPRGATKNWKHLRNELKDKNLKVCELALNELGLAIENQTYK